MLYLDLQHRIFKEEALSGGIGIGLLLLSLPLLCFIEPGAINRLGSIFMVSSYAGSVIAWSLVGLIQKLRRATYLIPLLLIASTLLWLKVQEGESSPPFVETAIVTLSLAWLLFKMGSWLQRHCLKHKKPNEAEAVSSQQIGGGFDAPIASPAEDELNLASISRDIADRIERWIKSGTGANPIGIVGRWGTGKTSLWNMAREHLKQKALTSPIEIIEFDPMLSKSRGTIQDDFFGILFRRLGRYDIRFLTTFLSYLKALDITASLGGLSAVIPSILDRNREYKRINQAIKKLGRPIVIFIDNLDRLPKEEIMEVLKLVGGNARFDSILYVLAYDKERLDKTLGDPTDTDFMDKYVPLEFYIPYREIDLRHQILRSQVYKLFSNQPDLYEKLDAALRENANIVHQYLPTIRDLKRYASSLYSYSSSGLMQELDLRDFILLQLLKYNDLQEYNALKEKRKLLFFQGTYIYDRKDSDFSLLLGRLFPNKNEATTYHRARGIASKDYFSLYFEENVQSKLIIISIFENLLKKPLKEIENYLGGFKRGAIRDYLYILDIKNILLSKQERYTGKEELKGGIYVASYLYAQKRFEEEIGLNLISFFQKDKAEKLTAAWFKGNTKGYKSFILNIAERASRTSDHTILASILEAITNITSDPEALPVKSEELIVSREDLLDVLTNELKTDLDQSERFESKHLKMLEACTLRKEYTNKRKILGETACRAVREKLINTDPSAYFENFVRQSKDAIGGGITCEPFHKQIFKSNKELEELINSYQGANQLRVKNFWRLYKANNYADLGFGPADKSSRIIEGDFIKEVGQLDHIEEIAAKFDRLRERGELNKEQREKLSKELKNIQLNISLREKLLEELQAP